jgi:hypothetical protein
MKFALILYIPYIYENFPTGCKFDLLYVIRFIHFKYLRKAQQTASDTEIDCCIIWMNASLEMFSTFVSIDARHCAYCNVLVAIYNESTSMSGFLKILENSGDTFLPDVRCRILCQCMNVSVI